MTAVLFENKTCHNQKKFKILYLNQAIEVKLTDLNRFDMNEIITRTLQAFEAHYDDVQGYLIQIREADDNYYTRIQSISSIKYNGLYQLKLKQNIAQINNQDEQEKKEQQSKIDQSNYIAVNQNWKQDILEYSFKSSKVSPDIFFPNGRIKFIKFERKKGNKRSFKCPFDHCFKFFAESGNLRTHLRTHTGSRPFICDQCNKSFITKGHLLSHELTHSGERPFVCTFQGCKKSYSRSGRLKIHMRSHTGQKPYKCEYQNCSKSFTERGNLKTHMRIHVGIKPHQCNICGKRFVTNGHLKDHIKTHSSAKPFCCEQCGKNYKRISTMHIHMRNCHDIQIGKSVKSKEIDRLKKEIITDEFQYDDDDDEQDFKEEEEEDEKQENLLQDVQNQLQKQEQQEEEDEEKQFEKKESDLIMYDNQYLKKELYDDADEQNLRHVKSKSVRKATKNRKSISKSYKQSQKMISQAKHQNQKALSQSVSQSKFFQAQNLIQTNQPGSYHRHRHSMLQKSQFNKHTTDQQHIAQKQFCKLQENKTISKINESDQKLPLLTKAQQELIKLRRQAQIISGSNSNQQPIPIYYFNKPQATENANNQFTPQSNSFNYFQGLLNNTFMHTSNNLQSNIKLRQILQGNYSASNSPFNTNLNTNFIPQTPHSINNTFNHSDTRSHLNLIGQNLRLQSLQARGITSLTPPPQSSFSAAGNIGFSTALQNYITSKNPPNHPTLNQISSVSPNSGIRNLSQTNFPYLFSTPRE